MNQLGTMNKVWQFYNRDQKVRMSILKMISLLII